MSSRHFHVAVLHNIRSAENVGSIFRTADAIGMKRLFLTGYTPTPLDRFGHVVRGIAKTALGAERSIHWETRKSFGSIVRGLKREGYSVIALEQTRGAMDYRRYSPGKKCALVVGNEVRGLSRRSLALCDKVIEISMRGSKESLNVSVAFGVGAFSLFGRKFVARA